MNVAQLGPILVAIVTVSMPAIMFAILALPGVTHVNLVFLVQASVSAYQVYP
jgi:hypothetical protein